MSAPQITVELTRHSGYFAGDMGLVHAAVKTVGCRRQYDARRRALGVPRNAADDVMAALELQFGADVQLVQAIA